MEKVILEIQRFE